MQGSMAGYLQGLGWGWLGRTWGLVGEQVVGVRLVLPSGRVLVARADRHPEIFWAVQTNGATAFFALVSEHFCVFVIPVCGPLHTCFYVGR